MRLPSRTNDPGKENLPSNGSSAIRVNNPLQPKRKNILRVSPSNTFAGESSVENSTSPQAKKFLSSAHLTLRPKEYKLLKDRVARKVRQSAMNPEIVEGFQGRRQHFTDVREFLSAPVDREVATVTFVRKVSLNSFDIKGKTKVDDCNLSNMSLEFQREVEKTFFDDRDDFQHVKISVNDNNFFRETCGIDLKDCSMDCFSVIDESYTSKIKEQFTEHAVKEEFSLQESILSNHVKYSTQISSEMLEMCGSSCHMVDIVTNMSNSPLRTLESLHMPSDKCVSLMRQSQGSCESADSAKLKPVLNRINKFLFFENSVDRMEAGDNNYQSSGCELINLIEEEEMSFRSGETPSRNFTHSSSFRSSETPKTSIRDRLAALQDSSEQNWRKRLTPRNDVITASSPCLASPSSPTSVRKKPITVSMSSDVTKKSMASSFTEGNLSAGTQRMSQQQQSASSECVVKRVKNLSESPSIAGRLTQLMDSQAKWVERSEAQAKDAHNFTVAGKMRRLGVEGGSPLMKTKKANIRPMTMIEVRPSSPDLIDEKTKDPNQPKVVKIPKMDADSFFEQSFKRIGDSEKVKDEVYSGELTDLLIDPDNILPFVRKIRPPRNNRGSVNPLKTRSLIIDVSDQYLEVRTGVAELEKKRVEKERIVGQVPLAQEALAGLASRENFSRVSLRKSGSFRGIGDLHEPFKSLMLLQVKGRRVCQTRLVEPQVTSFNSGDCFLLVTPEVVHLWMGRFSNVIERAKAQDLANQIVEKHDMGVKGSCQMLTFDEEKLSGSRSVSKLWGALGLTGEELDSCPIKEPGPSEEDELFEAGMISTNKVYRLDDENRLQFVPEYSGVTLQCSILKPSECLVFDFGSEMYTWSGKNVTSMRRKKAVSLALDIWNEGFDYSEALINPIHPLAVDKDTKASKRPDWCLFGKVSQNLETLLFKEKFIDWPDAGRMIKVKGQSIEVNDSKLDSYLELTPCSVEPMLVEKKDKSCLMLEGYHIGRGLKWEEVLDGIKWEQEMSTSELDVWHISESNHSKLSTSSFGQFHSGDTYVIRWKYNINQITRNLKGEISKRDVNTGRNRCAYFFWQGSHSSVTEKGASALMTMELNQDQGVHVRLVQGKEPSCFIGLFTCRPMFVYLGKRLNISKTSPKSDVRFSKFELSPSSPSSSFSSSSSQPSSSSSSTSSSSSPTSSRDRCKRLFVLRNELPEDSYFLEVVCDSSSLRSRTSFLLVDVSDDAGSGAQLMVWHGCKAPNYIRERICQLTSILIEESPPSELGLKMKPNKFLEMDEGNEPPSFHEWFRGNVQRESYSSLIGDTQPANHTPRLFHFSWTSGVFEAEEVQNPASNDIDVPSPFPFLQSDLYSPSQPALFLLDNHHEVFLWQGWWPSSSDEGSNLHTGSASSKFMMTKRCAMQTATNYCRAKNPSSPPCCYLVHAGCEPPQFTCMFPTWNVDEGAHSYAKENNLKPLEPVSDVLQKLNRSTYTWSELQEKPLPDGVDPLKLESYLDDEEFQTVMGMHRNEFTELPQWKQTNLKRKSGLF